MDNSDKADPHAIILTKNAFVNPISSIGLTTNDDEANNPTEKMLEIKNTLGS